MNIIEFICVALVGMIFAIIMLPWQLAIIPASLAIIWALDSLKLKKQNKRFVVLSIIVLDIAFVIWIKYFY